MLPVQDGRDVGTDSDVLHKFYHILNLTSRVVAVVETTSTSSL